MLGGTAEDCEYLTTAQRGDAHGGAATSMIAVPELPAASAGASTARTGRACATRITPAAPGVLGALPNPTSSGGPARMSTWSPG